MPELVTLQPAFSAGELAPTLWGRTDLAKYHVGAKLLRNFMVLAHGGVANRPGLAFVGRAKVSTANVVLIPFQFSTFQNYMLEFGNLYMRVIKDGGYVLEPTIAITAITQAGPGVFTAPGHTYANGDQVFLTSILGMTALNSTLGKQYLIANSNTGAGTFTLTDLDGNAISTAALAAYGGSGTVARVFTLTTPYAATDLAVLKYTQSADTMTLTHKSYAPQYLTRTQHWAWTLTAVSFNASVQPPTGQTMTASSAGALNYAYVICAITDSPNEQSVPSGLASGTGAVLNQNTGGVNTVTWTAPASGPTPSRYRVYRAAVSNVAVLSSAMFGYIGETTGLSFVDANFAPDFSQAPPTHKNPFASSNNPGCSTFYEQRQAFANLVNDVQQYVFSKPGNYTNMDTSYPSQDDDAISARIPGGQVNEIKHLVPMTSLLALTTGGAYKISGGSATEALTPATLSARPQAFNGCGDPKPIVINNDILYVQAKGSTVRDLSYNFYADVFTGQDISLLANHLFYGYTINNWCYAEEPFKQVWAARNDGVLLSLTYLKEQDVYAWAHSDSPGNSGVDKIISVGSVSEGAEDAVYVAVQRTIPGINGGSPVIYVERMHTRNMLTNGVADVTKAFFVDAGIQYSGSATATITGLDHLNGASVAILADGNVMPSQVVASGQVKLQVAASKVAVGLPYKAQLQTLDLDMPGEGGSTIQGRRKKIAAVTVRVMDTRGLKWGPDANTLTEFKQRKFEPMGTAIALATDDERMVVTPVWQTDGSVFVQQDYPLPCTVLAVMPELRVGDSPGA